MKRSVMNNKILNREGMQRGWGTLVLVLWALTLPTGCVPLEPPARGASEGQAIATERSTYTLRSTPTLDSVTMVATYHNRSAQSVYIARCGESGPSFLLEKHIAGDWILGFSPICPLIQQPAITVPAGGESTDTLRVLHLRTANAWPTFRVDSIPGTYRVVYHVYSDVRYRDGLPKFEDLLPEPERVSNPFRLENRRNQ